MKGSLPQNSLTKQNQACDPPYVEMNMHALNRVETQTLVIGHQ